MSPQHSFCTSENLSVVSCVRFYKKRWVDSRSPLSDWALADGRSWSGGMLTLLPSTLYGFQMCVSLWMCASLPSCWVQSSMVLRARDLSRSNSAGLISYTHKQITKSCFSCRAEPPLVFTGPDWCCLPLKCWYKIRLLSSPVVQSLGMGVNTWSHLFIVWLLHISTSPNHSRYRGPGWLTFQHNPVLLED